MDSLTRRMFMIRTSFTSTAILTGRLDLRAASATTSPDPWSPTEIMQPRELVGLMKPDQQPRIICVTFPVFL